jgi:hypothetical protein
MNNIEKLGLIFTILYFNHTWPESWQGGEVIIFFVSCGMFLAGNHIVDGIKRLNR